VNSFLVVLSPQKLIPWLSLIHTDEHHRQSEKEVEQGFAKKEGEREEEKEREKE
jgi:hypothetical protein